MPTTCLDLASDSNHNDCKASGSIVEWTTTSTLSTTTVSTSVSPLTSSSPIGGTGVLLGGKKRAAAVEEEEGEEEEEEEVTALLSSDNNSPHSLAGQGGETEEEEEEKKDDNTHNKTNSNNKKQKRKSTKKKRTDLATTVSVDSRSMSETNDDNHNNSNRSESSNNEANTTTTTTTTTASNAPGASSKEKNNTQHDEDGDVRMQDADGSTDTDNKAKGGGEAKPAESNGDHKKNAAAAATTGSSSAKNNHKSPSTSTNNNSNHASTNNTSNGGGSASNNKTSAPAPAAASSSSPPPPVMKGTLCYELEQRRHLIRGMWNYENSNVFPPQRFELVRTLAADEDPKVLPKDGEFHGSFSLAYFHTTSKGKQKERSKVIPENGVKIKFTKNDDGTYQVNGKGNNQFGVFHINGDAKPSPLEDDPTFRVELRKRYEPTEPAAPAAATATAGDNASVASNTTATSKGAGKKVKDASASAVASEADAGPLPEPSKSFPSGVVCLRGKLYKEESNDLGITEVVHRVSGMWAQGLDLILADPQNVNGLCNRFEYEHKSSVASSSAHNAVFPVSGRYSGWFDLSNDGTRTRINERDVSLKFKRNSAGYHNIEGKGSNVFGKYSITGSLTLDNVITIFRHFQPRKIRGSNKAAGATASTPAPAAAPGAAVTSAPVAPGTAAGAPRRPSALASFEPKLKLEQVKVPGEDGDDAANGSSNGRGGATLDAMKPPEHGTYSAVSRGVLRVNDDGSHTCNGKWAVTREHFNSGQTSNFNFRLEPHFAEEATAAMKAAGEENPRSIPLDSAFYKGSFQLKKQGSRNQTIVDQQFMMKFRQNNTGSFNVYGKGVNAIGEFDLLGTMVMGGKTGGHVELYRIYAPAAPPEQQQQQTATASSSNSATATADTAADATASSAGTTAALTGGATKAASEAAIATGSSSSSAMAVDAVPSSGAPSTAAPAAAPGTAVTSAPVAPGTAVGAPRRPSALASFEPKLKLEQVKVPGEDGDNAANGSSNGRGGATLDAMKPPEHGTYSAVSRGVLRVNDDGSQSCTGKWAVTREHFNSRQTSNFNFRLEPHFAEEATGAMKAAGEENPRSIPLDSAFYKGSFQLKKQGSRNQTIVDQQVMMKFRQNNTGSFNVYGKGVNAIGEFDLLGTMVMNGKTGGHVELYRIYAPAAPPEQQQQQQQTATASSSNSATATADTAADATASSAGTTAALTGGATKAASEAAIATGSSSSSAMAVDAVPSSGAPPPAATQRRESTRQVKLPSRLEDDDPSAMLSRVMDQCSKILKIIRAKDVEQGAFFSEPVDPVALGIPTYHQVIKEPMDLKTIQRKMEMSEITSPEEFSRLVRLVFENAMTFNVDPGHSVHQSARSLMVLFNQKFRDVERVIPNLRRVGGDLDDKGKKKGGKEDKKRKRQPEEIKSLKRRRLEEAQAMAAANAAAVAQIVAAAPPTNTATVSRSEFNMLLHLIQQLQKQIVETHTAVAELSPGDENDGNADNAAGGASADASSKASSGPTTSAPVPAAPAPAPEPKKKATRKKSVTAASTAAAEPAPAPAPAPTPAPAPAPAPVPDDNAPLSLEEQELLTDTINELPPEHLGGVIQIIREAAPVGADEDEIDLEIDQLDTKTQRKLLRHVLKFVKKPKGKPKKPVKPKTNQQQSKKTEPKSSASTAKAKPAPKPKPAASTGSSSFFAIGGDGDSDSESGEEPEKPATGGAKNGSTKDSSNDFKLSAGLGAFNDEHDEDDDLDEEGEIPNWNMPMPATTSTADKKKEKEEDDAWGDARKLAAQTKAREAERKAREEKKKAEAELAKTQRLAEATARGEELRAQRAAEEAEEARLAEEKEREAEKARQAAREAARAQTQSLVQTVDLGDAQRDIMKEYEKSLMDQEAGGASPSSDFGF